MRNFMGVRQQYREGIIDGVLILFPRIAATIFCLFVIAIVMLFVIAMDIITGVRPIGGLNAS